MNIEQNFPENQTADKQQLDQPGDADEFLQSSIVGKQPQALMEQQPDTSSKKAHEHREMKSYVVRGGTWRCIDTLPEEEMIPSDPSPKSDGIVQTVMLVGFTRTSEMEGDCFGPDESQQCIRCIPPAAPSMHTLQFP
ncbi:hypothetical protein SLEP1_g14163 [Rubroshorea leprosula]|uniref:Uncharacterized protein n=1 Tax=Rubroshorea leprosula TaxID=152421 RepID=A0AAV5ITN3_9ROSI|nr:hypothetical protein SLEP1_g14163 [Rubroshorea leprosula]